MPFKPKISIGIPSYHKPGRFFNVFVRGGINSEPVTFHEPDRMVVVTNVQGRFMDFVKMLIAKKVVDKALRWCYAKGHLMILGNVLDGDLTGAECLWLIYSLEEEARLVGGYVHFVPGQADLHTIRSEWNCQHPAYARKFTASGKERPSTALFGGSYELLRWMRTKNCIERVGNFLLAADIDLINLKESESWRKLLITVGSNDSEISLIDDKVLLLNDSPEAPLLCLLIKSGNLYRLFLDKPKEAIIRA